MGNKIIKKYLLTTLAFSNPHLLTKCLMSWPIEKEIALSKFFEICLNKFLWVDGENKNSVFKRSVFKERDIEVFYSGVHSGCACIWNLLMKKAFIENDYDRLIIVGSDTEFLHGFFEGFVHEFEKRNLDMSTHDGFNCLILTKKCLEKIGLFDENFFPCYYEDMDYSFRAKKIPEINYRGIMVDSPLFKHCASSTIKNNTNYEKANDLTSEMNKAYYVKKWGGLPSKEIYSHPYNDSTMSLNDWKILEDMEGKKKIWKR